MPNIEDFVDQAEQAHFNRQPIAQRNPEDAMLELGGVNGVRNESMAQKGIVISRFEDCFKPRYKKLVSGLVNEVYVANLTLKEGRARKNYIEALGVGRQLQQEMKNGGTGIMNVFSGLFGKGKNK